MVARAAAVPAAVRGRPAAPSKIFVHSEAQPLKLGSMSEHYQPLLEATIHYLEQLKAQGVRFVRASPTALSALAERPPFRPAPVILPRAPSTAPIDSQPTSPEIPKPRVRVSTAADVSPALAKASTESPAPHPALCPE